MPSPSSHLQPRARSELCHSEGLSPLLSSRGRFPSSGLKAHKSGAELSCHSTASPWRGAFSGSRLLPFRNTVCFWLVLLHTEHPSSSLTSQQEWAPGQAVGKALQRDLERNVLVRCRNPPSSARGHGGCTPAAEGTNIPERKGWGVSLPRTAVWEGEWRE